jgi:hypothetical protein
MLERPALGPPAGTMARLRDVPPRTVVVGRVKERSLQRSDSSVNNPLTLAGHAGQRVLSSTAKGLAHIRCQRTSQAADYKINVDVVGNRQGALPSRLRNRRVCAILRRFLRWGPRGGR